LGFTLSVNAAVTPEPTLGPLRFIDVILVVVAAPVLLLIGVPAVGYLVGGGVWIALRALEVGIERWAHGTGEASKELTFRLFFALGRVIVLALTVILLKRSSGKDDAITALFLIIFAFTIELMVSIVARPRSR
jgi:hypothetical protein